MVLLWLPLVSAGNAWGHRRGFQAKLQSVPVWGSGGSDPAMNRLPVSVSLVCLGVSFQGGDSEAFRNTEASLFVVVQSSYHSPQIFLVSLVRRGVSVMPEITICARTWKETHQIFMFACFTTYIGFVVLGVLWLQIMLRIWIFGIILMELVGGFCFGEYMKWLISPPPLCSTTIVLCFLKGSPLYHTPYLQE